MKVDFYKLDKDQLLISGIVDEILETHSYLLEAPLILPYIFDFVGVLFFVRKHWQEVAMIKKFKFSN